MARKLHRRYILSWDADFADHRVCNMIRKHRRPREQCPLHSYATTQIAHRVSLNWRQTKIKEDKRIVGQPWKHILMDTPHQSLHFLVMIARHSRDEDVLVWRNAFGWSRYCLLIVRWNVDAGRQNLAKSLPGRRGERPRAVGINECACCIQWEKIKHNND